MGFNRYTANDVTTATVIVTCSVDTVITIVGMTIANTSGNLSDVTVELNDTKIIHNATIGDGSALIPIGGEQKVIMVAGDTLSVTSEYTSDVVLSVLEQNL